MLKQQQSADSHWTASISSQGTVEEEEEEEEKRHNNKTPADSCTIPGAISARASAAPQCCQSSASPFLSVAVLTHTCRNNG